MGQDTREKTIRNKAVTLQSDTEHRVATIHMQDIMEQSPAIDKTSTWLIGGAVATIAIMFSNLDTLLKTFPPLIIVWAITIVSISVIAGLLEKACAHEVQVFMRESKGSLGDLGAVMDDYQEGIELLDKEADEEGVDLSGVFSVERILDQEVPSLSMFFRKKSVRAETSVDLKGSVEPNIRQQGEQTIKTFYWQWILWVFMSFSFLLAMSLLIFAVQSLR